jgi:hypothetical protein
MCAEVAARVRHVTLPTRSCLTGVTFWGLTPAGARYGRGIRAGCVTKRPPTRACTSTMSGTCSQSSHARRVVRRSVPRTREQSPVAATAVELNSYQGAVCAPRLLSTPHVSADIARVAFGDQSNEPGIGARWRLSLNLLRSRKRGPQLPTFDFALQEGNRMLSVQVGARRVVGSLSRVTSNSS